LGDELLENLRRGEVNQSSFSFTVAEDKWTKDKNGKWSRSISKFDELYDVSPVYNAAYSKTSVYMRGKEDLEKQETRLHNTRERNYTTKRQNYLIFKNMAKEKSTTELRDEKQQLTSRSQEIIASAKTEKRMFNDKENEELASIQNRKAEINLEIEKLEDENRSKSTKHQPRKRKSSHFAEQSSHR
jgi:hypothetical protein